MSELMSASLDYYRDVRDALSEAAFFQIYGNLFGVYLGFTAVCEIAQLWSLVFPKYIADPKIGLHFGRARGPMVHGVSFGHYQGVVDGVATVELAGRSAAILRTTHAPR